ncbi:metal dependent phosphohydrolase [Vulcanisaeta distributa DSM 14429]|uniref:5'-deoxynucleotidase n=1 Tax=Vulcanisaeta distributa (strain DSM 14429 / JCM 11212 / NBRC 100878 / IC-017) TaxID=572478 RepID=E1QRK8_VULDI|nr:metal dependent phosphohydrolase [Vulcanisaeta distributa DSM 14429]
MVSSLIDVVNIANTILNTPRIGWIQRGVPQAIAESVGAHVLLTSYLALILCNSVRRVDNTINADKCASMALIHDAHEALTGNVGNSVRSMLSNWKDIEVRLFDELQFPEELRTYFREYRHGLSIEGRIVNLSDKLATLIRACMYAKAGYDTRELIINYKELVEKLLGEFTGSIGQVINSVVRPIFSWCDNSTITNTLSNESPQ